MCDGDEQASTPIAGEPMTTESIAEPPADAVTPMPKSPITRVRAEQLADAAVTAARAGGRSIARGARAGAGFLRWIWRGLAAVPPAVRGFGTAAVIMLLGVVGAIALHNTFGLVCTVVVIPVCASVLGALGHRWYRGLGVAVQPGTAADSAEPSTSELRRSVEYVDTKLALALTSLGTDRHQQAVVALFQAKTAVELTLGTEQDSPTYDVALRADDYGLSPRGASGSKATSALREKNSLAAS